MVNKDKEKEDKERENSKNSKDNKLKDKEEEILKKYILKFLLLLLDYNLKDNKYKNILVSTAAVFEVSNNYS